jgi:hypothetical protein
MGEGDVGAPVVRLPERIDRAVRMGPFPSARYALKFLCYAAVGSVLAPELGAGVWLGCLAFGFLVSTWRPEGAALDERAVRWFGFVARARRDQGPMSAPGSIPAPRDTIRRLDGREVAILRAEGTPLAYRPPEDLERLFERFRDLLRSSSGSLYFRVGSYPLAAGSVLPPDPAGSPSEAGAARGYREFVEVLCRRRRRRRVDIAVEDGTGGPGASASLADQCRTMGEGLLALGVNASRLRGRALADAGAEFGCSARAGPP